MPRAHTLITAVIAALITPLLMAVPTATASPRPGLRAGHIPNSKNLPFADLMNGDGTMKDPATLKAAFEAAGVDLSKAAITTCGSGITAAVLSLALERVGHRDHALYDGSWTEWGMFDDLPIAKG